MQYRRAHAVGGKRPNAWGLYDTIGNVWEWCWDLYDPAVYGEYRVFRGGGWADTEHGCRASCRRKSHPTFRIDDLGFRVARSLVAWPDDATVRVTACRTRTPRAGRPCR